LPRGLVAGPQAASPHAAAIATFTIIRFIMSAIVGPRATAINGAEHHLDLTT
jgi:hypothetical protein